jgi:hypothetical protein
MPVCNPVVAVVLSRHARVPQHCIYHHLLPRLTSLLGYAVAISGHFAAVGAPFYEPPPIPGLPGGTCVACLGVRVACRRALARILHILACLQAHMVRNLFVQPNRNFVPPRHLLEWGRLRLPEGRSHRGVEPLTAYHCPRCNVQ